MSNSNGKDVIRVLSVAGSFAEDKEVARQIRRERILPSVVAGKKIILDFSGVSVATQSFVHAMISEVLRQHRERALQLIEFKSCAPAVKSVVLTVVEYSLDSIKA
jgi:hypothetical protein